MWEGCAGCAALLESPEKDDNGGQLAVVPLSPGAQQVPAAGGTRRKHQDYMREQVAMNKNEPHSPHENRLPTPPSPPRPHFAISSSPAMSSTFAA